MVDIQTESRMVQSPLCDSVFPLLNSDLAMGLTRIPKYALARSTRLILCSLPLPFHA